MEVRFRLLTEVHHLLFGTTGDIVQLLAIDMEVRFRLSTVVHHLLFRTTGDIGWIPCDPLTVNYYCKTSNHGIDSAGFFPP
jgi:hypothetical protein